MIYTDCKNSIQFDSCLCLQYIKNAFHFLSNFTGSYFSSSLFLSFGFFFFRTRTPVYSTHTLFSVQFPLVAWSGGCVWAVWALLAPTWRGRPLSFEIKFNRKVLYCLTIHLAFFFLPVICQSCKEVRSFPSLYSNLFFHNVHIVLVNIFLTFLKVESAGRPLYFCGPSFQNNRHGLYGSIW